MLELLKVYKTLSSQTWRWKKLWLFATRFNNTECIPKTCDSKYLKQDYYVN